MIDKGRSRSSVSKGRAFERRAYDVIKKELTADRIGLSPATARVFKGKSYYSRDRGAQVTVDVSIEVWLPQAPHWSLLWAAECKDYSSPIAVCEIEEFKSKLDQIAGANKKGALIASCALQRSALKYARTHGIAVIRLFANDQIQYVLHQLSTSDTDDEFYRALTTTNFIASNRNFYAEIEGQRCADWQSALRASLSCGLIDA